MKIICAGLSKTGTKSMNAALTHLGYKVYDFFENTEILKDGWMKIAAGEEPVALLRQMYADVDVGVDLPVYCYWEELLEAFPDAKVILTVRDNADVFVTSMLRQIQENNAVATGMLNLLSPTYLNWTRMIKILAARGFSSPDDPRESQHLGSSTDNRTMLLRQTYRRHIAHVKQCCPKDRLLVFNCKEGWEPLCKFLGLHVPDEPFPHKNVKGEIAEELAKSKTIRQVKKELVTFSTLFLTSVVAISYFCVRFSKSS